MGAPSDEIDDEVAFKSVGFAHCLAATSISLLTGMLLTSMFAFSRSQMHAFFAGDATLAELIHTFLRGPSGLLFGTLFFPALFPFAAIYVGLPALLLLLVALHWFRGAFIAFVALGMLLGIGFFSLFTRDIAVEGAFTGIVSGVVAWSYVWLVGRPESARYPHAGPAERLRTRAAGVGVCAPLFLSFLPLIPFPDPSKPTAQERAAGFAEITVGDLVVQKHISRYTRITDRDVRSLPIFAESDPRFAYPGVSLILQRDAPWLSNKYDNFRANSEPNADLYPAATRNSTVFKYQITDKIAEAVIRLDGENFFGAVPHVFCHLPLKPRAGAPHLCEVYGRVSERVSVMVSFNDRDHTPEAWPSLLAALEQNIRQITRPAP